MHPKEEIEQLKKLINYHNNLYYNLDNPVLSDTQYDELYKKLKDLEDAYPQYRTKNSPTQRVGGKASKTFSEVVHAVPMMSLDNSYNADDIRAWYERTAKTLQRTDFEMVLEAKIDGVSIPTKKAEANLRRFFSRVLEETGDDVLFNLDVTSGIRGGYHMFCSLGNVFLENRYTDWGN